MEQGRYVRQYLEGMSNAVPGSPAGRVRRCSKPSCNDPAVSTLTYVYSDSTAVLGPLATFAEPHCYDLCIAHSVNLTAPRGWDVVRLDIDPDSLEPAVDDLEALAIAVREAASSSVFGPVSKSAQARRSTESAPDDDDPIHIAIEVRAKGHLRMLRDGGPSEP